MTRGSGILLHVSSLPDGNFSRSAFDFIDFLEKSGVRYWQILAAGPTDCCDSPYSSLSVFAGNPKFIDKSRMETDAAQLASFKRENKYWLDSFVAFMQKREPKTDHALMQYHFFRQWAELREYANGKGIKIIGDAPIYPSMDSADVFGFREIFDFGGVAGAPPDYFAVEGQRWGYPLYNWQYIARTKYKWWIERLKHMHRMYDAVRIDHFRAFDTYYDIPTNEQDARKGTWHKGPGMKFFNAIRAAIPDLELILEDLGVLFQSVHDLREQTGFPGMKVMQFGFDGAAANVHLPKNYPTNNTVGYLSTHDNDTFVGFLRSVSKDVRECVDNYLSSHMLGTEDTTRLAIENLLGSRADVAVLTIQDLLFQGSEHRMNVPGVAYGNWKYRIKGGDLSAELCDYLRMQIERSGR